MTERRKYYKGSSRAKGETGEEIAEEYLTGLGMKILKRNFRFGRSGEIDIIAEDGDALVFVEVKSAKSAAFGDPLGFVTPGKIKKLRRAAEGYLYINEISGKECRFDVVAVKIGDGDPKLEYVPNAF